MRDVTNSAKEDKSGGITYTIKVIPKEDSKVNPEIIEKSTIEAAKIQTEEIVLKKPVKNDYKENNSFESNYSNHKEKSFNYKSSGGNEIPPKVSNGNWNVSGMGENPYIDLGNKGQGMISVPSYSVETGGYTRNYETYYRTMSPEHYETLQSTGNLTGTGETSISPTMEFSEGYKGVLVRFRLKEGTTRELSEIGVRGNDGKDLVKGYPNMPESSRGWGFKNAQFKQEGRQINIQLGKEEGKALEIFNKNIKDYEMIKEIK